jgi:hypothetical protein
VALFAKTKIHDAVQSEATVVGMAPTAAAAARVAQQGDASGAAEALGYRLADPPADER